MWGITLGVSWCSSQHAMWRAACPASASCRCPSCCCFCNAGLLREVKGSSGVDLLNWVKPLTVIGKKDVQKDMRLSSVHSWSSAVQIAWSKSSERSELASKSILIFNRDVYHGRATSGWECASYSTLFWAGDRSRERRKWSNLLLPPIHSRQMLCLVTVVGVEEKRKELALPRAATLLGFRPVSSKKTDR